MNNIKYNTDYKIKTPTGYEFFRGMRKLKKSCHYVISLTNGKIIKCSEEHPFLNRNGVIRANCLSVGTVLWGVDGNDVTVDSVEFINKPLEVYDILSVDGGNIFNVDGIVSHNCSFITSGNSVIDSEILLYYKNEVCSEPVEKRGITKDYWIWEAPSHEKSYMICADVARGDGSDFSAFHIFDIDNLVQVAEFKGKLDTRDYGNFLVSCGVEYNNALLVVENANIGWDVIQQILDRNYDNVYYTERDIQVVDTINFKNKYNNGKQVPGFTTSAKTRPLMIGKMEQFVREKLVTLNSTRIINELFTFVWNGQKAEAMNGKNDDLVMSLAMAMWVRDISIRLRSQGTKHNIAMLDGIMTSKQFNDPSTIYTNNSSGGNPYHIDDGHGNKENITWLF